MRSPILPAVLASVLLATSARAQNLVPNWNFGNPTPLKSWRVDFPTQETFRKNAGCVKQATVEGMRCAVLEVPAGTASAKIETALVPAVPGATYRVEAEVLLSDSPATIRAEAYGVDPRDEAGRSAVESKPGRSAPATIAEGDGHPPLVLTFQAPLPEPAKEAKWAKVEREFTLPATSDVAGRPVKPIFLLVRAAARGSPLKTGKACFTNFKLIKVKDPRGLASPAAK